MKRKYILKVIGILFLSFLTMSLTTIGNCINNNVYADSFLKENNEKQLAAEILYYGIKKVNDNNEGYNAVVNSLNNGIHAKKLAVVKTKYNNRKYLNDPTHHLSQHGSFVYSIYTSTNSDIPTYSVKNNLVYIYNIGDGAGPDITSTKNPIAVVNINDLKKAVDHSWINSFMNKLSIVNAQNIKNQDIMTEIDKVTNGN